MFDSCSVLQVFVHPALLAAFKHAYVRAQQCTRALWLPWGVCDPRVVCFQEHDNETCEYMRAVGLSQQYAWVCDFVVSASRVEMVVVTPWLGCACGMQELQQAAEDEHIIAQEASAVEEV